MRATHVACALLTTLGRLVTLAIAGGGGLQGLVGDAC